MFSSWIFGPLQWMIKCFPLWIFFAWMSNYDVNDSGFLLQQSLYLCVYFYVVDAIERIVSYCFKVDQKIVFTVVNSTTLAVLFSNVIGLSMMSKKTSSSLITTVYGFAIQVSDLLLMIIEMIQVINFILAFGDALRSKIFDADESIRFRYKFLTVACTVLNYLIAIWLVWNTNFNQEPSIAKIAGPMIVVFGIVLFIFNLYYQYIIIEASSIALYMAFLYHLSELDFLTSTESSPLPSATYQRVAEFPESSSSSRVGENILLTLMYMAESLLDACKKGFLLLTLQTSPLFWIAFILRIKCLIWFIESPFSKTFSNVVGDDDDDGPMEQSHLDELLIRILCSIMPSHAAMARILFVIGFTTTLLQRTNHQSSLNFLAKHQWMLRAMLSFISGALYVVAARIFHRDEDDDYCNLLDFFFE